MRLEATNDADRMKVWLTDEELEELRHSAASYRDDIIIQLGRYVGLRSFEITQIQPGGGEVVEKDPAGYPPEVLHPIIDDCVEMEDRLRRF